MSSGGGGSGYSGPPEWFQDSARTLLDAGMGAASQPYVPYQGQRVADLSGIQRGGLDFLSMLGGPAMQGLGSAGSYLDSVASGQNGTALRDRLTRDVTDRYGRESAGISARFSSPGNSLLGDRAQLAQARANEGFTRGLGDALAQADELEQNRRMQAATAIPGLLGQVIGGVGNAISIGDIDRRQNQSLLDSLYGDFTEQRDYPWTQLQRAGGLLSNVLGGVGRTETATSRTDPVSQGLGLYALSQGFGGKGGTGKAV